MTDNKPKNYGGPAFPCNYSYGNGELFIEHGMTMRDWFAGMALQGLLSRDTVQDKGCNNAAKWAVMNPLEEYETRSSQAYRYADAMIAEREK